MARVDLCGHTPAFFCSEFLPLAHFYTFHDTQLQPHRAQTAPALEEGSALHKSFPPFLQLGSRVTQPFGEP